MKAIYLSVLLAACTQTLPVSVGACPVVPECTRPNAPIETNADLVRAYQETDHALQQCTLYRNTLASCLKAKNASD